MEDVPSTSSATGQTRPPPSRGLKTTLALSFKGDLKRESRWLAQYGQAIRRNEKFIGIRILSHFNPASAFDRSEDGCVAFDPEVDARLPLPGSKPI